MTRTEAATTGLRQRTRDAVREQIAAEALLLFDEQGFDETTIDQIARAVGVSRRSFFRYFPAKEDVVLGNPMIYGEPVRERLEQSLQTMPIWDALRAAVEPVAEHNKTDPEGTLRATRVMIRTPSLRARNTEKHLAWMTVLAPLVANVLTGSEDERRFNAHAITTCALACIDVASAELVHYNGTVSTEKLLDKAFALLRPATLRD